MTFQLDISDGILVPRFQTYFKGYKAQLKNSGKADTQHNPEIPSVTANKIYKLVALIYKILKSEDNSSQEFRDLVEQLPQFKKTENCSFSTGICDDVFKINLSI